MNADDSDPPRAPHHPGHYKSQAVEPITYMMIVMTPEMFKGYLLGNVIKYVSRAEKKNGKDDYEKAKVYADWLDEFCRTGRITPLGD